MLFDTIAAISTPRGEGGIGIIRISGDKSFEILERIFNTKNPNRDLGFYKFNYGFIHDNGKIVDEVMAVRMKAPKTYTCEDVVEINCHGGHLISEKVLELVLKNGARHAEQGEFTKRAFMNGRIDLSQAEAVMDIIHGKTEKSISLSLEQLRGDLRDKIASFKKALLDVTAHVNVVLDYPEEGIDDPLPSNLRENLENVYAEADRLISSYDKGKKIKEGIKTVIAGKPNVGKSTLLNSLLKEERAIVTHIPGTTRDVIEEIINIKGIPLVLTDTAGIRKKSKIEDSIEYYSVLRAVKSIKRADVCVLMLDATELLTEQDKRVAGLIYEERKPIIIAINKWDLIEKDNTSVKKFTELVKADLPFLSYAPVITISALTGKRTINILEQAKFINEDSKEILAKFAQILDRDLDAKGYEELTNKFLEQNGLKLKDLAQALRIALTGSSVSPSIFEVLEVVGSSEIKNRIQNLLKEEK